MADEITLKIDGKEVKTQSGKMIIQAAMDAGMYIPYLCYYPGMKPYGACRMCVVEIEGGPPGMPASCTTPAADGMEVTTHSPKVGNLRGGIMDLVLSEHPHGCLNCHRIDLCGPSDVCLRHVAVKDRCVTCPMNERRAQRHCAISPNGDGHAADVQQPSPAPAGQRSALGHGHEPLHRLCAVREGL